MDHVARVKAGCADYNSQFQQKYNAERILEKHFNIDIDYKKTAPHFGGADLNKKNLAFVETKAVLNKKNGGQNIKKYFLSSTYSIIDAMCILHLVDDR